jgi:predicted Rdx family selenoprotein
MSRANRLQQHVWRFRNRTSAEKGSDGGYRAAVFFLQTVRDLINPNERFPPSADMEHQKSAALLICTA